MNKQDLKNSLKRVIDQMVSEYNRERYHLLSDVLNMLIDKGFDTNKLDDPKVFRLNLMVNLDFIIEKLSEEILKKKFNTDTVPDLAVFMFKEYAFVEKHLYRLFEVCEGATCCVDKARTVYERILEYIMTGNFKDFDYSEEYTYMYPKMILKDKQEILDYIVALRSLYNGNPVPYLKFMEQLNITKITTQKDVKN
ncbi:conserved hypothetical protein (plasmid) [Deferribacter desulfuricans SSM1]|uniref:Uncharacterized protein n=1 Tax=Deferribacter desulfuricans (strain DSM 14783 / JCM 11476 / NBRC 101012 / SSM1) TaxID=639282 RepID=D3PEW4_DEFDS|nr:hypothetical protein [Deferribacter desulfuricans]BAI81756.1 conserved hypothetical protein [Deferribacter desulfuricans SSM1]